MVILGKPKERRHQYVAVQLDDITMHRHLVFGEGVRFQVSLAKFLFYRSLRLDPLPGRDNGKDARPEQSGEAKTAEATPTEDLADN